MANYVSKELAKGRIQIPSYAPYIDFPSEYLKGSISSLIWQLFPGRWQQPIMQLRLRSGRAEG